MAANRRPLRPSVRQAAIVEEIEKKGRLTVEQLALAFNASPETVRRDLNALAEEGRIRKVHGAAVRAGAKEGSFDERLTKNLRAKQEVAEKVAKLILPGQSIMMDTGTATLICAEALVRVPDLTVITNSTRIADCISSAQNGSSAILLGGNYRADNAQTVGAHTCAEIGRYRTDHVILTISALDNLGAYDFTEAEAQVARVMIDHASALTLVADCAKLGQASTFKICDLDNIDKLVLESEPEPALSTVLEAANIDVI